MLYNNQEIEITRKLEIYEVIISLLPIWLTIGGAIGGGLAGLGMVSIIYVNRTINKIYLKILSSIIITSILSMIYFIIAKFVLNLI